VGQEVAREFRERGVPFAVIERNPEQVELARAFGYMVVEGDASAERSLIAAGIGRAKSLIAASDSDSGNTYIALTAKSINPGCHVVARASSLHNEEKLKLAGADRVLSLYAYGGRQMVLSALQPLAADFMDTISSGREGELVLAEFEANNTNGLEGKTVGAVLSNAPTVSLLGVRQQGGGLVVGPSTDYTIVSGDIAIVLGTEREIAAMVAPIAES
jgi:voltage-gated potassium channel